MSPSSKITINARPMLSSYLQTDSLPLKPLYAATASHEPIYLDLKSILASFI